MLAVESIEIFILLWYNMRNMTNPGEHEVNGEHTPDILHEYAGLLTDVADLIEAIEHSPVSKELNDTFRFPAVDDSMVIPVSVTDKIGPIETIELTLDVPSSANDPSSFSIDLIGADQMCVISRASDAREDESPDMILDLTSTNQDNRAIHSMRNDEFEDRLIPIKKIPLNEVNALLMSLVSPDSERGYEMFESADLLAPKVLEGIRETLQYRSASRHDGLGYTFATSGETTISYARHEGQPTSFTIMYPEHDKGRVMLAKCNLETDFQLAFSSLNVLPGLNGDMIDGLIDFHPTVRDVQKLRIILEEELEVVSALTPEIIAMREEDAEASDNTKNPTVAFDAAKNDYFSNRYTQDTLFDLELQVLLDQQNNEEN